MNTRSSKTPFKTDIKKKEMQKLKKKLKKIKKV